VVSYFILLVIFLIFVWAIRQSRLRDFALAKDGEQEGESRTENAGGEQVSAADYDPSLDHREDKHKCLGDKDPKVGTRRGGRRRYVCRR
jgi:hypothetical protein